MNEVVKKYAVGGSAVALAIAMGLQTFVFGQSDIQTLKQEVAQMAERLTKLEAKTSRE